MADEAALRKQLETCEDFTERREIRRKLRELRESKFNDPEADAPESHSRHRRRQKHTEETTTTTSDGVRVTETHTTKTEIIENGDVIKKEEVVEVSSREEPESEPDGGSAEEPNGGAEAEAEVEAEAEAEAEAELEEELEEELKEELKEELIEELEEEKAAEEEAEPAPEEEEEEAEDVPPYAQKSPENLTEREIEEIDDLDFLETTLNALPIKFFDVRKFLRARIRKVKVSQGGNRRGVGVVARAKGKVLANERKEQPLSRREWSRERNTGESSRSKKFEEQSRGRSQKESVKENNVENSRLEEDRNLDLKEIGNRDFDVKQNEERDLEVKVNRENEIEKPTSDLGIKENGNRNFDVKNNEEIDLEVTENREKEIEKPALYHAKQSRPDSKEEEFTIEQFASDTLLKRLDEPNIVQHEDKEPQVYSEDEDSSLSSPSATSSISDMADNPPTSPDVKEDNSRKTKDTATTGALAHRIEALETGKKKTDFKSQLKKTGLSPRKDLTAATKKPGFEKIDLRKNLKSVPGAVPLTRRGSWSEKYGPSLKDRRPSKRAEEEPANVGSTRRISSSDLFNLIGKPVEPKTDSSKQAKPKQHYKYEPPKIVEPENNDFDSIMAKRKKSASRQFNPTDVMERSSSGRRPPAWSPKQLRKATYVPMPKGLSRLSVDNAGAKDAKDGVDLPDEEIDDVLKDVVVKDLELQEGQKPSPRPTRKTSSGNIKWVEGPQINIQDKSQLSQLRQQIEQQKKEKEAGGANIKTTTTKTTEVRHGGTGSTTTITKTSTTREVASGGIGGKGGMRNFEEEMARKKKDRQTAKAQAFKNTKDKRNAFKDQLEASNPKPAGGVKKSFSAPNTAVTALLEWCRRKTRGYENVNIQNYTTSWANGLAMCALFHNFSPDLVPWETLDPQDRKRNWTLAFEAAYGEGMDPILELEDVLSCPVPEPRSLITYVHSIYQHFHDKAEKAKLEKEQKA